jgi:hypothetical protein
MFFCIMNQAPKDDSFTEFLNYILTPYTTEDNRFISDLQTYETRVTNETEAYHGHMKYVARSEHSHANFYRAPGTKCNKLELT